MRLALSIFYPHHSCAKAHLITSCNLRHTEVKLINIKLKTPASVRLAFFVPNPFYTWVRNNSSTYKEHEQAIRIYRFTQVAIYIPSIKSYSCINGPADHCKTLTSNEPSFTDYFQWIIKFTFNNYQNKIRNKYLHLVTHRLNSSTN